jgi:hypothetical protein
MDWLFIASNFSWRINNSKKRLQALAKSRNTNDGFWAKATFQLMVWLLIASNFSWRIKNFSKRLQALAKSKNINVGQY